MSSVLSASARKAEKAERKRLEGTLRANIARARRRGDSEAQIQAMIANQTRLVQQQVAKKGQETQAKIVKADTLQAKQRARAGATGAQSAATKASGAQIKNIQEGISVDPKTGGFIFTRRLSDSVNVSDSSTVSGGGQTIRKGVSDAVSVSEPIRRREEEKTQQRIIFPEQIERAEYEARAGDPNVLAKITLKDKVKFSTLGNIPLEAGQKKGRLDDPIARALQDTLKYLDTEANKSKNKDPLKNFVIGATEEVVSFPAYFQNLGRQLASYQTGKPPTNIIDIQPTLPSEALGVPIRSVGKGLETGNVADVSVEFGKSAGELEQFAREQDPYRSVGQFVGFALPFGKLPLKAVPLRLNTVKIPTETGTKTFIRVFSVGYGKRTKPFLTQSGTGVNIGGLPKSKVPKILEDISPEGRGFEFGTETRIGQDVLLSEVAQDILENAGKLTARGREQLRDLQKAAKIVGFSERKVKDRIKVEAFPEQPSTAARAGAESEVLTEKILPKVPPIKGTIVEKVQIAPETLPKGTRITTSDVDVDYAQLIFGTQRAQRRIKISAEELQKVIDKDRKITTKGTKLITETKGQPPEKLLEFLTKKDVDKSTSSLNKDLLQVFGADLGKKIVKVPTIGGKKIKLITLESQTLRRIASASALQGPRTEKASTGITVDYLKSGAKLPDTAEVIPPGFRLKDLARLPRNFVQIASNLEERGFPRQAGELRAIGERIKTRFPEIEFEKYVADTDIEIANLPSRLGSVAGSSASPASTVSALKTIQIPSGKASVAEQSLARNISKISQQESRASRTDIPSRPSTSSPASRPSVGSISFPSISFGSRSSPSRPSRPSIPSPASPPSPSFPRSPGSPGSPRRPASRGRPSSPRLGSLNFGTNIRSPTLKIPLFFKLQSDQTKSVKLPGFQKSKLFIADPPDPLRAGVLLPAGVKQLIGKTPKVFKKIDINLGKARRRKGAIRPFGI